MRALAGFAPGEEIVAVPLGCLLTRDAARRSPIGKRITASGVALRNVQSYLAMYLLEQRRAARSAFEPYIDALPRAFPTVPIFYGPSHLALLEGSFTLATIAERRRALRAEYEALIRAVPAIARHRRKDFLWARTAVGSRIFSIAIQGRDTAALVPLSDMMNHAPSPNVRWGLDDARGAFVMTAERRVERGELLHHSYGRKCNSRFFVSYGFALADNDDNEASVTLRLPDRDPQRAAREKLLGGATQTIAIGARAGSAGAMQALSFLRAAHASPSELAAIAPRAGVVPPLSARCEVSALTALATACETSLRAFTTSVEDDDALLGDPGLDAPSRAAITMRRGEKRVLARWIALVRAALPILRRPWEGLAGAAAELPRGTPEAVYLAGVVEDLRHAR